MTSNNQSPPSTGRIEAFSDGVIAIIITIMVLELKAPAEAFASGNLGEVVVELGPKLLVYGLSFLVVAVMLINHHTLMRAAPHATVRLFWWNALLLFWMSLIPLGTAVAGEHPSLSLPVAFYGAIFLGNAVCFTLLNRCAATIASGGKVVAAPRQAFIRKDMIFTALYALSIPAAYVSVYISWAIFLIVPAAYFIPDAMAVRR